MYSVTTSGSIVFVYFIVFYIRNGFEFDRAVAPTVAVKAEFCRRISIISIFVVHEYVSCWLRNL